jgi:RNase P subunit RPR2
MTEQWAVDQPGFCGTIKQLTCCGKCGKPVMPSKTGKLRGAQFGKPSFHFICDDCYEGLPT